MLLNLPGMTEDIPPAIMDWIDTDFDMSNQGTGGAEEQYYLTLPEPYSPKNDRFETVEELLMVRGVTRQMLYGDGTIPTVAAMAQERAGPDDGQRFDRCRAFSRLVRSGHRLRPLTAATGGGGGGGGATATPQQCRVNVNTAPRSVLLCLGLTSADVDKSSPLANPTLALPLPPGWTRRWPTTRSSLRSRAYITAQSYRYSADILAVSGNGRAFKRAESWWTFKTPPHRRSFTAATRRITAGRWSRRFW